MTNMLYPINTVARRTVCLDGMWKIHFDFEGRPDDAYGAGIPGDDWIPVPSSFADLYTEKRIREFCGNIWYETNVWVPSEWKGRRVELRFGAAAHRAQVFFNGRALVRHEGGFLPFVADLTDVALFDRPNRLVVRVNNELTGATLPNGETKTLKNGVKYAVPHFDFFNYSGLQRSVWLVATPMSRITDFSVVHALEGADARVSYAVETQNLLPGQTVRLDVYDAEGSPVASAEGESGDITIRNVRLWQVRNAYLYRFVFRIVSLGRVIDEYEEPIGVRTVEIRGTDILVNGKPVYLKGFGRHEDTPVNGRGYAPAYIKRDYELMKWTGANSFRTSHYPYAEEMYQLADREGFLIIDEVAAVGFIKRLGARVFVGAGTGEKPDSFFGAPSTPELLTNHINALKELIARDKNHASVIAWSLFNEPESVTEEARAYFKTVFDKARELDPQKRPRTFAMELSSGPDAGICHQYCDFWTMNRYYGWYVQGGYEMDDAILAFREEMDEWARQTPVKPMVFTEYGADTYFAEHKLPSVMWSQEYQVEYLRKYHEIFDAYPFVKGEQIWNFADFQTTEGIARVNGNKKGVFTRDRQPKDCAYLLKARWESLPLAYKADGEAGVTKPAE